MFIRLSQFELSVPLASVTDIVVQAGLVMLLVALFIAGVVTWVIMRRWGPALRQLSTIVDKEVGDAERSVEAINEKVNGQVKRVSRQGAAIRQAVNEVRSLTHFTRDIEERTTDLRKLAQQMAAESSQHGGSSMTLAEHVVTSTEQLTVTVEQLRKTYNHLLHTVNQFATEADGARAVNEEVERHIRDASGAIARVNVATHDPRLRGKQSRTRTAPPRIDEPPIEPVRRRYPDDDAWPAEREQDRDRDRPRRTRPEDRDRVDQSPDRLPLFNEVDEVPRRRQSRMRPPEEHDRSTPAERLQQRDYIPPDPRFPTPPLDNGERGKRQPTHLRRPPEDAISSELPQWREPERRPTHRNKSDEDPHWMR